MDENNKQASRQTKTGQVEVLNQEAWAVRVSDSIRALELSKEAVRLSTAIRYTKGKG